MIRLEAYLDGNSNLRLAVFENSKYETAILKGIQITKLIEKFYRAKVTDIQEKSADARIVFENCVLNLNEYKRILNNKEFQKIFMPIIINAQNHQQVSNVKKLKKKKVTRKNKHTGKKIIALGLAAFTISMISVNGLSQAYIPNIIDSYSYSDQKNIPIGIEMDISISEKDQYQDNIVFDEVMQEAESKEIKNFVTENSKQTEQLTVEAENKIQSVSITYEDQSNGEKVKFTNSNYRNLIEKYSNIYGVDSNLMLAIATQERGVHSEVVDPEGGVGLMQIQFDVWGTGNANLSAYNFQTGVWENTVVDPNRLSDLEYNIETGCKIYQNYLYNKNYNIIAALQSYNMGIGSVDTILDYYCSSTNKSQTAVLSDQTDIGWLEYRNIIPYGDSEYVEHVLRYYGNEGVIKVTKPDGEVVSLHIDNNQLKKGISIK